MDTTELQDALERLFSQHDPMGLVASGSPPDEYHFEALEVLRHLPAMYSPEQVRSLIWGTLAASFNGCDVGPEERYSGLAAEVWDVYQEHPSSRR